MGLTLDFTGVEAKSFEALPAATYSAFVYDVELKPSKAGDSMNLNWTFKINAGEYENRQLMCTTSLKPTALWKVKGMLQNICPEMNLEGLADLDLDSVKGKQCRLQVIQKMYEGELRNEVKNVIAPDKAADGNSDLPWVNS